VLKLTIDSFLFASFVLLPVTSGVRRVTDSCYKEFNKS